MKGWRKSNLQKPAVQVLAAWSSLSFRLFCAPPSSCDLDPLTLHIWTVHSSTFSTNYSIDAIVNQVAKFDDYVFLCSTFRNVERSMASFPTGLSGKSNAEPNLRKARLRKHLKLSPVTQMSRTHAERTYWHHIPPASHLLAVCHNARLLLRFVLRLVRRQEVLTLHEQLITQSCYCTDSPPRLLESIHPQ